MIRCWEIKQLTRTLLTMPPGKWRDQGKGFLSKLPCDLTSLNDPRFRPFPSWFSVPQIYVKEGFWISGVLTCSFHWVFGSVYNFYLEAKLIWEKDSEVEIFFYELLAILPSRDHDPDGLTSEPVLWTTPLQCLSVLKSMAWFYEGLILSLKLWSHRSARHTIGAP